MKSFDIEICDIKDLEKLLAMKQEGFFQNRKPRRFRIVNESKLDLSHKLFDALIEVLFHFHEKGIIWEELQIYMERPCERFMQPLLYAINTMKIFKRMRLVYFFYDQVEAEDYEENSDVESDEENQVERIEYSALQFWLTSW